MQKLIKQYRAQDGPLRVPTDPFSPSLFTLTLPSLFLCYLNITKTWIPTSPWEYDGGHHYISFGLCFSFPAQCYSTWPAPCSFVLKASRAVHVYNVAPDHGPLSIFSLIQQDRQTQLFAQTGVQKYSAHVGSFRNFSTERECLNSYNVAAFRCL